MVRQLQSGNLSCVSFAVCTTWKQSWNSPEELLTWTFSRGNFLPPLPLKANASFTKESIPVSLGCLLSRDFWYQHAKSIEIQVFDIFKGKNWWFGEFQASIFVKSYNFANSKIPIFYSWSDWHIKISKIPRKSPPLIVAYWDIDLTEAKTNACSLRSNVVYIFIPVSSAAFPLFFLLFCGLQKGETIGKSLCFYLPEGALPTQRGLMLYIIRL